MSEKIKNHCDWLVFQVEVYYIPGFSKTMRSRVWLCVVAAILWIFGFFLCGEMMLRWGCFLGLIRDIQVDHHVQTSLWPFHRRLVGSIPVLDPDFKRSFGCGGTRISFNTLACPNPLMGYRRSGFLDDRQEVYAVVLGDSMTEAAHVDDRESYVGALSRLAGRRFVNLGVVGQGVGAHIERLKLSGFLEYRPRVLILQVGYTDIYEDVWLDTFRRVKGKKPSIHYLYWNPPAWFMIFPGLVRCLYWMKHHSLLFFVLYKSWLVRLFHSPPPVLLSEAARHYGIRLGRRHLDEIHRIARSIGAGLLILGDGIDVVQEYGWRPPAGVRIVVPHIPMNLRIRLDGHWNGEGHAKVARTVHRELVELGWLGPYRGDLRETLADQSE